jgi:hypothetical protein
MRYVVGFGKLMGDEETLARILADVLDFSVYDGRLRIRAVEGGPGVAAVFPSREEAQAFSRTLREQGIPTVILHPDRIETDLGRFLVSRFAFGSREVEVVSQLGEILEIPFDEVNLILLGTAFHQQTESKTLREKKFSLGRAVISGGLVLSKTTKTTQETTSETRENFLQIYAGSMPPVVFRESALSYESLGPVMRQSRHLNFNFVVQKLKEMCPAAVFDDRLTTRLGQSKLLGPSLVPEAHLDVALSLLAASLRPGVPDG